MSKSTCPDISMALLGAFLSGLSAFGQPTTLPAFPGAEGFGASTPGGRGGAVYEVTNLNDSGPGSFRDAVSQPHRIVVFRVSGYIDLQRALRIGQPFITIAGQTAPGDGVCIRYRPIEISTHDVILRFVRSRLGDVGSEQEDAISILNRCKDVIVDHCSASWGMDETLSTSGDDENVTVQWCIISEALHGDPGNGKKASGYGSLARANGAVSWYHNLWAHDNERNPRLGDNYGEGTSPFFDFRYNVMYDFGQVCSGTTQGHFNANYVGNYIRPGLDSKLSPPIHVMPESELAFFIRDNVLEGNAELTADNLKMIDRYVIDGKTQVKAVDRPFASPPMRVFTAKDSFDAVLAGAGARLPTRDAVDTRVIQEVREGKGRIISSEKQVGGWPELKSAPAPLDSDHDGMPDAWEQKYGLNPNDPSDGAKDLNGDGYTNVEKYLNGIDPARKTNWRDANRNVDPLTADRR